MHLRDHCSPLFFLGHLGYRVRPTPKARILYENVRKNVSSEFDKFRVNTNIWKLCCWHLQYTMWVSFLNGRGPIYLFFLLSNNGWCWYFCFCSSGTYYAYCFKRRKAQLTFDQSHYFRMLCSHGSTHGIAHVSTREFWNKFLILWRVFLVMLTGIFYFIGNTSRVISGCIRLIRSGPDAQTHII